MRRKDIPIRKPTIKGRQFYHIPDEGYLTPRLQVKDKKTEAVGFHHNFNEVKSENQND